MKEWWLQRNTKNIAYVYIGMEKAMDCVMIWYISERLSMERELRFDFWRKRAMVFLSYLLIQRHLLYEHPWMDESNGLRGQVLLEENWGEKCINFWLDSIHENCVCFCDSILFPLNFDIVTSSLLTHHRLYSIGNMYTGFGSTWGSIFVVPLISIF